MATEKLPRVRDNDAHYVRVPRVIATDACNHDLEPDECLILATLVTAALRADQEGRFQRALAAGRESIEGAVAEADDFARDWNIRRRLKKQGQRHPAPQRLARTKSHGALTLTYKAPKLNKTTAAAGRKAFASHMKRERSRRLKDHVVFRITRRALLRRAHLPTSGQQFARLDRILDRLSEDVSHAGLPPLVEIEEQSSGELLVKVNAFWLAQTYVQVPLPWPIRSGPATFLWLALHCIPTGRNSKGYSRITELGLRAAILGSRTQVRRALSRAVQVINLQIQKISIETIEACERAKINVPSGFRIGFPSNLTVRIVEGIRRFRAADHLEPAPPNRIKIAPVFESQLQLPSDDDEGERERRELHMRIQRENQLARLERYRASLYRAMSVDDAAMETERD